MRGWRRPNGLTGPPWARCWQGASGRRRDFVAAAPVSAQVTVLPVRRFVVGFAQQALGSKTQGARKPHATGKVPNNELCRTRPPGRHVNGWPLFPGKSGYSQNSDHARACFERSISLICNIRVRGWRRPNGLTRPPWARCWQGASGQRRDVVVSVAAPVSAQVTVLPVRRFVVGFAQQALGSKTQGARKPHATGKVPNNELCRTRPPGSVPPCRCSPLTKSRFD